MTSGMKEQIADHLRTIEALGLQVGLLETMADLVIRALRADGRVYVFGNGGSAADAQHIAAELLARFKRQRRALPATALTTDTSLLTAIGNDLGGDEIFRRQIEGLVTERDVVWALSVSGRSPNVLCGLDAARSKRATIIGFTSRTGTPMAEYCDLCLVADAETSDRVQEAHELAYHLICDRIERAFA